MEKGKKGKREKIKMDQISHSEQTTAQLLVGQTDQDRPRQTISVSISCSRTFLELRSSYLKIEPVPIKKLPPLTSKKQSLAFTLVSRTWQCH